MIRVFPHRTKWTPTDNMVFVGYPPLPLFRPDDPDIPVHISVTFTWDKARGEELAGCWNQLYNNVQIGGPAYDDPGEEFIPGRYLKDGVTITSRGCPHGCSFCYVHKREGAVRELEIKPGHILQDNNLLACSRQHIEAVFNMIRANGVAANFNGGLDARLLQPWHRNLFDNIKLSELWFACDTPGSLKHLESAAKIVEGISINKLRCYVMVGYGDETIEEATSRLESVYELGFLPFCQLYRGDEPVRWSQEWRHLARCWSRPAIYKSIMKKKETPIPRQRGLWDILGEQ